MRALSIRQPWAWAILHAGKDIENRDWKGYGGKLGRDKGFRGDVLIHASQRPNPTRLVREGEEFSAFCRERRITLPDGEHPGVLSCRDLFRDCGGIVGIARIVDIRPNGEAPASRWAIPGLLGLVLAQVEAFPQMVPCNGARGFWTVPPGVQALVDEQLLQLKLERHASEDRLEMKELGA